MAYDDVLTRNEDQELAVRVVNATESATVVNPNDVYTRDTDGNLAIRTVGNGGGGGGSDPHNLGWYATQSALETAHPTAENGDWAIVGSTDTVWVWDSDTNAWKDTDQKGQVTSVNGQTGAVTVQETLVNQSNIKSVNGNSLLGSGNLELSTYLPYPAGWTTNSTTKAFCDDIAADTTAIGGKAYLGEVTFSDLPASMVNAEIVVEIMAGTTALNKVIVLTCISGNTAPYMWKYTYWNNGTNVSGWKGFQEQLVSGTNIKTINGTSLLGSGDITTEVIQVSTMPTASADELGKIYQYIGATDSTYTNAYFYKCVSDGQNPATYSWEQVDVMPAGSSLPSQTGNAGKFLTTNGTDASWGTTITGQEFNISRTYTNLIFNRNDLGNSCILLLAQRSDNKSVAFYHYASYGLLQIAINGSRNYNFDLDSFYANSNTADLGTSNYKWVTGYITKLNNGADITVPTTGGIIALQIATLPTAAASLEGQIYQYTGATDSTYTNGRFYKCVSDGQPTPTYSWEEVSMGGGGSSYTAGTGIDITSGVISVTSPTLQNTATGTQSLIILGNNNNYNYSTIVGVGSSATGNFATAYGRNSGAARYSACFGAASRSQGEKSVICGDNSNVDAGFSYGIGIGYNVCVSANHAIQLGTDGTRDSGGYSTVNSDANTLKVGNANGNFELMSANGTIPTDRFTTTPVADGSYIPTLTISSGVATRTWGAAPSGPVVPSTMPTLAAASWSNNAQTVTVSGVTASNVVIVAPAPASAADYAAAGIICTAQSTDSLTFTCTTTPSNDIVVNVVII